jgi:Animal haem peroxidase
LGVLALLAVIAAAVSYSNLVVRNDSSPDSIHWRRGRDYLRSLETRPESLDGSANNRSNPTWGQAGLAYSRVAPADYADGLAAQVEGPEVRGISNRIFNDSHQNIFSENRVTQWGWLWAQFVDHTIGHRDEAGEAADLPFNADDPLEEFTNTLGVIPFSRSAATPGTGETTPREQTNTESSYIDAEAVYGTTPERLEWLREGPVDGDMSNNSALLLLPDGVLPRSDARGDAAAAPTMAVDGRLRGDPASARVAGDVRANENSALTATQTLFAREHNRIVGELPDSLTEEQKFQIARRVVIAEQQYITYNEFLPAVGVDLPRYRGYNPRVNPTLSNEFATVGFRGHSMIHGGVEIEVSADRYSEEQLQGLEEQGVEFEPSEENPDEIAAEIPLGVLFFNPGLADTVGYGPLLQAMGVEPEYQNDAMIDNQLRSVLFQIPVSNNPQCLDGEGLPECFQGVVDLAALDIQRGRDHGMPSYNDLREAFGLPRVTSFTEITGEDTDQFPADPELTPGAEIDDPESLDFLELRDFDGNVIDPADEDAAAEQVFSATRRTTTAARLAAIYGSVDDVDAFVGMSTEAHVPGTEFGPLELAMWAQQFQALRDGDRFFYGNDQILRWIRGAFGVDFRTNLGDVIARNTDVPRDELAENVFLAPEEEADAPSDPGTDDGTVDTPAPPADTDQQPWTCQGDHRRRPCATGMGA